MPSLTRLVSELGGTVAVACVYIAEAHAQDEWPISSGRYNAGRGPIRVAAPTTDEDRVALARRLVADFAPFHMPVVVDTIADGFEAAYAPWPFRFFGLTWPQAGGPPVLGYVAHPRDCSYDLGEARAWAMAAAGVAE